MGAGGLTVEKISYNQIIMNEYTELKKASPEEKALKIKDLIKQAEHMVNMWEGKEEGWNIYYAHGHISYVSTIKDFADTCPDSEDKKTLYLLLDKLDSLHKDFVESMSNH